MRCAFPVLHLSQLKLLHLSESIRCVSENLSEFDDTGHSSQRSSSGNHLPTAGAEGSEERTLTLRTEPLRCEIHRREVSSMLQQSKRPCDAQRAAAWPKRIRGSVAKWCRVQADPLMMSRCSTWQNASLKEPSESTEYPWRKSSPAEELTTDSVPLPVGPIAMWQAAMITNYDMMIEFTSDKASWNILQPTKHTSVAKMFVRDQPQSVRFMILVTDPLNLSQREVIKVTREVTETTPLICSPQAPLEMVLMKPLSPRLKKKQLIEQTPADRANVGKIDKPNAEIVALRDDWSDIAKGTESKINDVIKTESDKAAEAKTDAVAENKTCGCTQECDSKTKRGTMDRGPTADAAVSAAQHQYVRRWNECSTNC